MSGNDVLGLAVAEVATLSPRTVGAISILIASRSGAAAAVDAVIRGGQIAAAVIAVIGRLGSMVLCCWPSMAAACTSTGRPADTVWPYISVWPFARLVRADRRFVHALDATGAGVLLTVKDRSGD